VPRPHRRPGQPASSGQAGHAGVVAGGLRRRRRSIWQGDDPVQAAARHGDGPRGRHLHPPLPQPRSVPARVRIFHFLVRPCPSRDECFLGFSILFPFFSFTKGVKSSKCFDVKVTGLRPLHISLSRFNVCTRSTIFANSLT
jgi:hypothetical protein